MSGRLIARARRRAPPGPWLVVAAAVAWNLLHLRAETLPVSYLDDSSVHEQMVRFATLQFGAGHLPLTSWVPFLGLGSPQFLHYQSLPAMLTGLIGLVVGPDAAFRWTMYVLLSIWPVSVYLSMRLFGGDRRAAAAAAAMSPFLASVIGIGYEQEAYVWIGFGVWTQLWASITLPLAWGLSWRAIRDGRGWFPAVALIALTTALHFETGYLAVMPLVLWPFVAGRPIVARLRRAAVLLGGAVLASSWVIVPVVANQAWAARNEVLHATPLVNGYGIGQVLVWLVSGRLLDAGRIPVVTILAAVGLALALARRRTDTRGRALVVVLIGCILLSSGRATFGPLVDVIPGSGDLFFRRFMMGIQLTALLLAGLGAGWLLGKLAEGLDRWRNLRRGPAWLRSASSSGPVRGALACAVAVLVLAPAWTELSAFDDRNTAAIDAQRRADATAGAQVDRLIDRADRGARGRVYAGALSNWGGDFRVGAVPVFKYLESRDVDEVGYTLRTASLMTIPEYFLDDQNVSDYDLFGIRYLVLPSGWRPPVRARLVTRAGRYALWSDGTEGYVRVGRIVGLTTADRTDLGARSIPLLRSGLPAAGAYLRVDFGARSKSAPVLPALTRTRLHRPGDRRARRSGARRGEHDGQDAAAGDGGAGRIIRSGMDGHRRRSRATHGDGGTRAGGRPGLRGHAQDCLQVSRLRRLSRAVRTQRYVARGAAGRRSDPVAQAPRRGGRLIASAMPRGDSRVRPWRSRRSWRASRASC